MTKVRLYFYLGSGLIAALLPILLSTGLIGVDTSDSVKQLLAAVGSLIGASGGIVAGTVLNKQTKEGTLDKLNPGDQIVKGAQELQEAIKSAQSQAEQAKEVLTGVLGSVPVLGPQLEDALSRIKF